MTLPPIGTVVAKNYLPFARVLAHALRRYHPDARVVVLLADELDGIDPAAEPFSIITPQHLGIPELRDFAFRASQWEFSIALKPYLIGHLAAETGSTLFLDADSLVLDELGGLLDDVQQHALTLVPHRLVPPSTVDAVARDLVLNLAGIFNGGVIGMSLRRSSAEFIRWWQMRVHRLCIYAPGRAMHYDQRWLDHALGFVEDLHLHRDPGVNVAHWNLPERPIRIHGAAVTAGGARCRLFHFSGFDPDKPRMPTKYRPELQLSELGDAQQLFHDYAAALQREGWAEARNLPYAYACFDNGVPIPDAARRLFAATPDRARFGNPFATNGKITFFEWLRERPLRLAGPNRLWLFVHSTRPDLQTAFPRPRGRHSRRFQKWIRQRGMHEHDIPSELV